MVQRLTADLLAAGVPTYLRGQPGSGKSSLLASCVAQLLADLSADQNVEWEWDEAPKLGDGRLATPYWRGGQRCLLLVQLVGLQVNGVDVASATCPFRSLLYWSPKSTCRCASDNPNHDAQDTLCTEEELLFYAMSQTSEALGVPITCSGVASPMQHCDLLG